MDGRLNEPPVHVFGPVLGPIMPWGSDKVRHLTLNVLYAVVVAPKSDVAFSDVFTR